MNGSQTVTKKFPQLLVLVLLTTGIVSNLVADECCVCRLDGLPFSVKDFGAVGDGVHDDTSNIQDAIDSFPGQGSPTWIPWVLYFPPGTYKVTSPIYINDQYGGAVFGYGATLKGYFDGPVIHFGQNMWFSVYGLTVQQDAGSTNAIAVETADIYTCRFKDIYIYMAENMDLSWMGIIILWNRVHSEDRYQQMFYWLIRVTMKSINSLSVHLSSAARGMELTEEYILPQQGQHILILVTGKPAC